MRKCKYIPKYKDKKKDTLAAECEAAWMRMQTAKSEAMTPTRKPVDRLLLVGNQSLGQKKQLKYLRGH